MKNIIISVGILILLLIGIIHFTKSPVTKKEHHIDSTYTIGKTEQLYKKGKDSVIEKAKSFGIKTLVKQSGKDSAYNYFHKDSLYNISINIKQASEGMSLDYLLNITSKELLRIDTIYQIRVDTIKIKETISERIDPPFYNTFIFGVIIAGAVILLLINYIN